MKRRDFLALTTASLSFLSSCSHRISSAKDISANLDNLIHLEMKDSGIPGMAIGMAIGMAKNGRVVATKGYGYADIESKRKVTSDTMFHIASITKTITATSILQLSEGGLLNLDESIQPYLDFNVSNPFFPSDEITFRQLLLHTSSISDVRAYEIDFRVQGKDSEIELKQLLENYLVTTGKNFVDTKCFLNSKPGSTWSYSNIGYSLLGYLAERLTGKDLRIATQGEIFAPLGMNHTVWSIAETQANLMATPYQTLDGRFVPVGPVGFADWPAGMIRSSVSDITVFAAATANAGTFGENRILAPELVSEMLNMNTPRDLPKWLSGQGLGWASSELSGRVLPNHWGGDPGVFTAAYIDPTNKSAAVILMNIDASSKTKISMKKIVAAIFDELSR